MVSLTAVIRCTAGSIETVLAALKAVGDFVEANEPGTLAYVVTRSTGEPAVLLTHEQFTDTAAMEAHNTGEGSKAFFAATEGLLEDVSIYIGDVELAI